MMPALFFSGLEQYLLLQATHPPDADALETWKLVSAAVFSAVLGFLVKTWITRPLEKASEYEDEEQKQLRADMKEMKEWRDKTSERILKLEIQTENGIKGLNEKLGVVSAEVGEVKRMMGDFRETLAGLKSYFEKPPRSSRN